MLINCPHCNTALDIAPEHFGQSLICPACRVNLQEGLTCGSVIAVMLAWWRYMPTLSRSGRSASDV
jgi:hypothetical protein